MSQRHLAPTALLLLLACLLSMLSHTATAYGPLNHACCVKYTVKPLPFSTIKGFIEQSSREVCRIDAIIFYTVRNKKVCASAKDEWVKAHLTRLSAKLKTLATKDPSRHIHGKNSSAILND
ncbi:C-C motif chemokine 20 [Megalops cyprinoides]|uniref:C-C motif chemokine 20 n=1 Tax=Megalops cyprinoides TaxID=118141 RepID=UPI0018642375|nr:C-C motif chemokine 20 [Megalops cyprinoides]